MENYISSSTNNTYTHYCVRCGGVAVYSISVHDMWHMEKDIEEAENAN
jgi:hypothetical protein